jgi:heptosyltransferase-3
MKTLAIQFRYLGDAALMTPALRAIAEQFPDTELHVLVAEEAAPLLEHLPWLEHVWRLPRVRGRAAIRKSWPVIKALRREHFERTVDFGGNDRGAIISLLCNARERLGFLNPGGFIGRRFCYTKTITILKGDYEAIRNLRLLSAWAIAPPARSEIEIRPDPAHASLAERLLPRPTILCHLTASQPKKEWPMAHWTELYRRATEAGRELIFSTGISPREQAALQELKNRTPGVPTLPPLPDLAAFLAVLKRARLVITGDTSVLHFAAGLGVPTISLFGPSSPQRWAPLGTRHRLLQADGCACGTQTSVCLNSTPCMATISPRTVCDMILMNF